jgi:anthranilate phosphoribosyltransferase
MKAVLAAAMSGEELTPEQLRQVFQAIFRGELSAAQIAGLVVSLRMRGETASELACAAAVMRENCVPVRVAPKPVLLDTCGTGGDGSNTFNISTAAALVIAACDVPVAKHGNRAASSKVGSADVLEALGVRVDLSAEQVARCIEELGVGFMFARSHHPAMKHVAQVRAELGVRTIFNFLGPLSNPAAATHQVIGVPEARLLKPFANALSALGTRRAWIVHGHGGLDELSLSGATQVIELDGGEVREFSVEPVDFGLRAPSGALSGVIVNDIDESARVIRGVLGGEPGHARDVVLLNAAAGLVVAGRAGSFREATQLAAEAIDGGAAMDKLMSWAALSHAL